MHRITRKEIIFQLALHLVAFLFYSFDKRDPTIHNYEIGFFINYALAALIINFYALPRFYRNKNIVAFVIIILLCVAGAVLVEEFVLEKLFFPGNRGKSVMLFFAALKTIPVITILSGFKFGWDALHMKKEVDRLKDVARQSELQFLKSQINPHFLFNNLNNLYSYALEGSPKTSEIILELSGLLRYMLYECKEDYVPLRKEIDQLKNFINLNELQIEERGVVSFSESGIMQDLRIAPLILIVFIENAFKHSLSSQSDNIFIEIDLKQEGGRLQFSCRNSFAEKSNTDRLAQGIGLKNVKKRLDLMYAYNYTLDCKSDDGVYTVQLVINLK